LSDTYHFASLQLHWLKYRLVTDVRKVGAAPMLNKETSSLVVIRHYGMTVARNFIITEIKRDAFGLTPPDSIHAESNRARLTSPWAIDYDEPTDN
jgi:hypothetical protein